MDRKVIKKILHEVRSGRLNYLKQNLPDWPDYVIKDFAYQGLKNSGVEQMAEFIEEYRDTKWVLERDLMVTMDMFGQETKDELGRRNGGNIEVMFIPRDRERHQYQKQQLLQRGLPTEPIIMFKSTNNEYELLEGWHRTIQLFNLFPKGFKYPNVWVGILSAKSPGTFSGRFSIS